LFTVKKETSKQSQYSYLC